MAEAGEKYKTFTVDCFSSHSQTSRAQAIRRRAKAEFGYPNLIKKLHLSNGLFILRHPVMVTSKGLGFFTLYCSQIQMHNLDRGQWQ